MSFLNAISRERTSLVQSAFIAIIVGLHKAWDRCRARGHDPQEPDFVAALVLESIPIIASSWVQHLRQNGISLSVVSVFCHQTPKIQYIGMKHTSCELGDVLFVHIHTDSNGKTSRNALLCQAKCSSKQPYKVASGEKDQLALYQDWPDFEYVRSGSLSGQTRAVRPKMAHPGAQYLLIDDRPPYHPSSGLLGIPNTYPIGVCLADEYLHDHADLASELFQVLSHRSGRVFEDRVHAAADGWSTVIWDLLRVGLTKAFNRRRAGYKDQPRITGASLREFDGLSFTMTSSMTALSAVGQVLGRHAARRFFQGSGDLPPLEQDTADFAEESGVSLVIFETAEAGGE